MFKKIFSVILLFFFVAYVLSSPIIWAVYYIYKDYIFENYCENKDIPSCCGKCHITKIDSEQSKDVLPKVEVRNPEITSIILTKTQFSQPDKHCLLVIETLEQEDISLGFIQDIFVPPEKIFLS